MIKKLLAIIPAAFLLACNGSEKTVDYAQLYKHSLEVKDYHSAIFAAQCILQQDSTQKAFIDSLPELYAAVNNFAATEIYTDKALKARPQDEKLLQLKALCLQEAGKGQELMDMYQKLYASTKKPNYLYQVATIQLASGDVKSAESTVKELEPIIASSKDSVDFMVSETEKQKVPIKAALYNVKAYIAAQHNDLLGAKKNFELALKEFPDFITAQQNYMRLMQGARGGR